MDKTKQTLVIALVAVLVVVAGGWYFLISPQRSSVASLNAKAVAVEQANAAIRTKIAALRSEAIELPGEQTALAAIARRLPPDLQEANLLNDLSHAADAANVDLQGITPSAPVAAAGAAVVAAAPVTSAAGTSATTSATTSAPATVPQAAVPASQLYQIPLSLTVSGNYFDLEMFIHSLEGMQRAMLINQLTFARPTAAVGGTGATTAGTSGTTGNSSTKKTSTGSTKVTKSTAKPVPGTAGAAQAELDRHPAVPVDSDTLTVTILGSVFSMYSPAAAAAAVPTVSVTPAPTK